MSSIQSGDIENQQTPVKRDSEGTTWWCRILVKLIAGIAAIACFICGILVFVFGILHPICIFAAILMIFLSCIIILLELPICCSWFDKTKGFVTWSEKLKYWHKGLFYCALSVVPVAICASLTTFLGCLSPFATGVIYGLMSLGKKADRGEMMANAASRSTQQYSKFENEG